MTLEFEPPTKTFQIRFQLKQEHYDYLEEAIARHNRERGRGKRKLTMTAALSELLTRAIEVDIRKMTDREAR